jgi:hypothetical protein
MRGVAMNLLFSYAHISIRMGSLTPFRMSEKPVLEEALRLTKLKTICLRLTVIKAGRRWFVWGGQDLGGA